MGVGATTVREWARPCATARRCLGVVGAGGVGATTVREWARPPNHIVGVEMDKPLAYFLTFSAYGSVLPGDESGYIDRKHNGFRGGLAPRSDALLAHCQACMKQSPYLLDAPRRDLVLSALLEVCRYRGWQPLVIHVRSNHVHIVVQATDTSAERVIIQFKAYASRALDRAHLDAPGRLRWARHGSTCYLWTQEDVIGAIGYVAFEQGEPMALYAEERLGLIP